MERRRTDYFITIITIFVMIIIISGTIFLLFVLEMISTALFNTFLTAIQDGWGLMRFLFMN